MNLRRFIAGSLATMLVLSCCACESNYTQTNGQQTIFTQKSIADGRTPLTVMVKFSFSISAFEKAVEEKFPDIDLVQVGNYANSLGIEEYTARLEHDDLTDIVMTWPLETGEEFFEDRLLNLSGMEFSSRYNLSMLNTIAHDGKLYYLPGPAQVRGIVYNKTLFKEKGWNIPENFEEFLALCNTIEASGIRSLQLGFKNPEVLDAAFMGYNYANFYSKPQDAQWIEDYNSGVGDFGDHFGPALDIFQWMIDEGVWKPSDLDIDYAKRADMLFNRQCAMVEDSVLMCRMGETWSGTTDEFALMPFFSPDGGSDWVRLYMVCYIGLNKHLAEPENKEKYKLALKLMDYISTPEGQDALAADTGAMFSSLTGGQLPNVPEIELLKLTLTKERCSVFIPLKNAQSKLREGLAGMISRNMTKEDVIAMVNQQNLNPQAAPVPETYATATEDFSLIETGNFITDVMRSHAKTDLALFLDNGKDGRYNAKGICGRLYEGSVTSDDLTRIISYPQQGERGVLCTAEITGKDLIEVLEHSIVVRDNQSGWFYYFSGLKMQFDPTATPGNRVKKITLADGSPLKEDHVYSLAMMDLTVPEDLVDSLTETDETIVFIVTQAMKEAGTISPCKDGRFTVVAD